MNETIKKYLSFGMQAFGGIIAVVGAYLLYLYIWEIVIRDMGKPDRSMLFWGLPLLFMGLPSCAVGCVLMVLGWKQRKGKSRVAGLRKT